jgi:hypothetical protein
MPRVRRAVLIAAAVAMLAVAPARGQSGGGTAAPDFDEPCPAVYPGDGVSKERIARWMARGAADRGLPHELPVMAAIAESGLRNLRGSSYAGFFGMSLSLNRGEYRGFPRHPDLQLHWFLDTASLVRQRRVAEGRPDPAQDEASYGIWIADVERPAREFRSLYQAHLDEARSLIAGKCAAPDASDATPPRLEARIAAVQHPLATGGIVIAARCPDHDCLVGAKSTVGGRVRHARAREPLARGYTTLVAAVPRAARRALRAGRSLRARVTVVAADQAANPTARRRLVTLVR